MKLRKVALIAMMIFAAVLSSSGPDSASNPSHGPTRHAPGTTSATGGPPGTAAGNGVVSLTGLPDLALGSSERELSRRGVLDDRAAPCGPQLADEPTADPVFAGDRLVLLWANDRTSTPEGVHAGTSLIQARATYPQARPLTAPPGTYRLDGLLVRQGDRAYLFLHDGRTVRKTVVGYADYAQRMFDDGFGTC
ncbi:hypothetical protein [Plantactinospora sp. KBS50]|uniref:hypothetical protein n=1 Tax=Plantactinospora sp. KBS50 TaxID=2024580 RepID=UPI000BAAEFAD|nr:hypothetical protein [Plantactinospora sp. KBS50]ASW57079.1 hypothetical protein CIK06_27425 [Plantactinospora sp. KBS50]